MGPPRRRRSPLPAALGAVAALLATTATGCGSSSSSSHTKSTATAATGPTAATTATGPTAPSRPHTTPTAPSGAGTGGTPAPSTGGGAVAHGRSAAIALVARQGYSVTDPSTYRSDQTLRVLVGATGKKMTGRVQRAFFFVNDRYLGTDTSAPSAGITVAGQDDTSVTLSYRLFRPSDPLCCPSGGRRSVRFVLDNGELAPSRPIPPADPRAALSRR
ncbi:MAG: LppP/LprE family lipoprotein [Actinobacteria bacterium]|nr:MAG: LppP/LprE family lipoprotein [Actinomycetota bacterium]